MAVRVLIVFLVGPLLLLSGVFFTIDWMRDNLGPDGEPLPPDRVSFPAYRTMAEAAVAAFEALPDGDRQTVLTRLEESLVPASLWLERLPELDYDVLCIGENHAELTRTFLAERLFPVLRLDALFLEVTAAELRSIEQKLRNGQAYVALLGADIAAVIRAARRGNPELVLSAIDESSTQRRNRERRGAGSRDESIANNFWKAFDYGKRHAILFGALHCTDRSRWLFRRLRTLAPRRIQGKMFNLRVLGEHQTGATEAFVHFLDRIGVTRSDFVIDGAGALPPQVREWLPLFFDQIEPFQTVVVFRA